jgi:hypothetical protein
LPAIEGTRIARIIEHQAPRLPGKRGWGYFSDAIIVRVRWLIGRNRKRQSRSASNATIRRDLVALSGVMGYAIDQGWRGDDPVLARRGRLKQRRHPIALPEPETFARPPVKLCKPWLFWHHTGEPYKTASGRVMALVKSYARSPQNRNRAFGHFDFTICGIDMLSKG